MKNHLHCIAAILAVICLTSCNRNIKDIETGPYTISVIDDNVYHIQDYNSSYPAGETFDSAGNKTHFNNCSDMYLIAGEEKALLIDLSNNVRWADNAAESLRQIVAERIDGKELTITFTHNHGDHTGMLHAFADQENILFALPEADFGSYVTHFPSENHILINEGHIFDLGRTEIEAIAVPGHTDGSMVFYMHGNDILFTGDAIGSGHGVWIFNSENYKKYSSAVPHLIEWIENPENGVNIEKMRIYGGHYWQRDWLPELEGKEMGMSYIRDMQQLLNNIENGSATTEPSGLDHPTLDTYFRYGTAIVVWNAGQAEEYRNQ